MPPTATTTTQTPPPPPLPPPPVGTQPPGRRVAATSTPARLSLLRAVAVVLALVFAVGGVGRESKKHITLSPTGRKMSGLLFLTYNGIPEIEQQPKVIQVSVVKWVFIIPLQFKGYAILETVDFVSRRLSFFAIH